MNEHEYNAVMFDPLPPWVYYYDILDPEFGNSRMTPRAAQIAYFKVRLWKLSGGLTITEPFGNYATYPEIGPYIFQFGIGDSVSTLGAAQNERDMYIGGWMWDQFVYWNFSDQTFTGTDQNGNTMNATGPEITLFDKWQWYKDLSAAHPWSTQELLTTCYVVFQTDQGFFNTPEYGNDNTVVVLAKPVWKLGAPGTPFYADVTVTEVGQLAGGPGGIICAAENVTMKIEPYKYWTWNGRFDETTGLRV